MSPQLLHEDYIEIYQPKPGTDLEYKEHTNVTIHWRAKGKLEGEIISWWLCVGTKAGQWDIVNGPQSKNTQAELEWDWLPVDGHLWAQVMGKVDTEDQHGNVIREEINSDPVVWRVKQDAKKIIFPTLKELNERVAQLVKTAEAK